MQHGPKTVVTLFHSPNVPASARILRQLEAAKAEAQAAASSASKAASAASKEPFQKLPQAPFELEITEAAPTKDQLRSILGYLGNHNAGQVVAGANDSDDALYRMDKGVAQFQTPIVSRRVVCPPG